jgi:hypothetical protein
MPERLFRNDHVLKRPISENDIPLTVPTHLFDPVVLQAEVISVSAWLEVSTKTAIRVQRFPVVAKWFVSLRTCLIQTVLEQVEIDGEANGMQAVRNP